MDLEAGTVLIGRSVAETRSEGPQIKRTKRGTSARIALGSAVVDALRSYRRWQADLGRALGNHIQPGSWLFSLPPGAESPWLPSTATRKFSKLRTQTGHTDVKLMSLRHFLATQRLTSGTGVRTAAPRSSIYDVGSIRSLGASVRS